MTDPVTTQVHAALSVAQAAAQLDIGIPTLRRLIARRQIAHCRLNRRVTLLPDDIRAYIDAHRIPAAGEPARAKRGGAPRENAAVSRPARREAQ